MPSDREGNGLLIRFLKSGQRMRITLEDGRVIEVWHIGATKNQGKMYVSAPRELKVGQVDE